MINSKNTQRWLIIIILIMFYLGASRLFADILYLDEYWSIRNSGGTFGPLGIIAIWNRTATLDPGGMGVLYHWLLAAWEAFIGISTFSVRAFSLLAGVLAVGASYRLGKELFSATLGFYGASIMALSAFYIDYLHEARAYTLLVFFTVCAVYAYHRIMHYERTSWFWYPALSLFLAAVAYTHYVALAMGVVLGLYHLLYFRMNRRWWLVVAAMAIGGLLFLPWLGVTLEVVRRGVEDSSRQGNSMNAPQIIENLLSTFSNLNLALFVLLALFSLREISRKTILLWIWFIASLILVIIVNIFIPFMVHLRYLLFVWPALALIMALGIHQFSKPIGRMILLVWLAVGIFQSLNPNFISNLFGQIYRAPNDGFQLALNTLKERGEAGDMALFRVITPGFEPYMYFPLDYYFKETDIMPHAVDGSSLYRVDQFERMNNSFAGDDNNYLKDVNLALDGVNAVWSMVVPELPSTQKSGVVNYVLSTQFASCETVLDRDDMLMSLFVRPPQTEPTAIYGNNDLRLFDMGRGYQNNEAIHVVLAWWTETLAPSTYSIALHLFDSAGNLAAQSDFGLPDARPFSCTGATVKLDGLDAGDYQLKAKVYAWQTGEGLQRDTDEDYVTLRTIHRD